MIVKDKLQTSRVFLFRRNIIPTKWRTNNVLYDVEKKLRTSLLLSQND
jgi:hypothetical protein